MTDRICSAGGCDKPFKARGLCQMHYARYRYGTLNVPSRRDDWADRFLRSVDTSGDCWLWTGRLTDKGYGSLGIAGKEWAAHRVSYLLHNGDLPDDAFICHHCDNPPCVNPAHLYAGTPADNVRDMIQRGRGVAHPGEACGKSKLTEDAVMRIRQLYATGRFTQKELAEAFGIRQPNVSSIIRREVWRHVS